MRELVAKLYRGSTKKTAKYCNEINTFNRKKDHEKEKDYKLTRCWNPQSKQQIETDQLYSQNLKICVINKNKKIKLITFI